MPCPSINQSPCSSCRPSLYPVSYAQSRTSFNFSSIFPYNRCPAMSPHRSLRFSPSGDDEAMVIKSLIVFWSASSMNSRNATRVAGDVTVLSEGNIFVALALGRPVSMHGGAQVLFFDLLWCFLLLGPILCWRKLFPYP